MKHNVTIKNLRKVFGKTIFNLCHSAKELTIKSKQLLQELNKSKINSENKKNDLFQKHKIELCFNKLTYMKVINFKNTFQYTFEHLNESNFRKLKKYIDGDEPVMPSSTKQGLTPIALNEVENKKHINSVKNNKSYPNNMNNDEISINDNSTNTRLNQDILYQCLGNNHAGRTTVCENQEIHKTIKYDEIEENNFKRENIACISNMGFGECYSKTLMELSIADLISYSEVSVRLNNCMDQINKNDNLVALKIVDYINNSDLCELMFLKIRNFGQRSAIELTDLVRNWKKAIDKSSSVNDFINFTGISYENLYKIISLNEGINDKGFINHHYVELSKILNPAINDYYDLLAKFEFPSCLNLSKASTRLTNTINSFVVSYNDKLPNLGKYLINREEWEHNLIAQKNTGKNTLDELTGLICEFIEGYFILNGFSKEEAANISKKLIMPNIKYELPAINKSQFINLYNEKNTIEHQDKIMKTLDIHYQDVLTAIKIDPENTIQIFLAEILDIKKYDVLNRRFGIERDRSQTLEEIGKSYGITRERVRQIEAKALKICTKINHQIIFNNYLETKHQEIIFSLFNDGPYVSIAETKLWKKQADGLLSLVMRITHEDIENWLDVNFEQVYNNNIKSGWYNKNISQQDKQEIERLLSNSAIVGGSSLIARIKAAIKVSNWPLSISQINQHIPDISPSKLKHVLLNEFAASIIDEKITNIGRLSSSIRVILTLRSIGREAHVAEIRAKHKMLFGIDMEDHTISGNLQRLHECLIVRRGTYCLYENLGIDDFDIKNIRNLCAIKLIETGHFISAKILRKYLGNILEKDINRILTPYIVLGVCQDDSRFAVRRGLMIGLAREDFEENFTSLNELIHNIVKINQNISIKEIHEKISHQRDVLDAGIALILNSSPDLVMVDKGKYSTIEHVFKSNQDLEDFIVATQIALIDKPVSFPILITRLTAVNITYNSYTVLSFLRSCGFVEREQQLIKLTNPDPLVEQYNELYHQYKAKNNNEIKREEFFSNNNEMYQGYLKYDYRFFIEEDNSNKIIESNNEGSILNSILLEFEF